MEMKAHHWAQEVEGMVVPMEDTVRTAAVAGAVGDSEVAVVADMIAGLTEVAEVDQEGEEAWGKCDQALMYSDACKCFPHLRLKKNNSKLQS